MKPEYRDGHIDTVKSKNIEHRTEQDIYN